MTPEKTELKRLEATGEYVFHGTSEDLETLEPQQAVDTISGPDGPPAVFASDRADYAIFMAIVNARNCLGGSQSKAGGTTNADGSSTLRYGMTNDTAERLEDSASGWVYVFPKTDFEQRDFAAEFVSVRPAVPIQKIRVTKEDLPEGIELYETTEP